MKFAQFFETAAFTRAEVLAVQDATRGYKLVARMRVQDDEPQKGQPSSGRLEGFNEPVSREIVLTGVDDAPRYFKSLSSLPAVMRERRIFSFSVQLGSVEVATKARKKKKDTTAPAAKTTTAKGTKPAAKTAKQVEPEAVAA